MQKNMKNKKVIIVALIVILILIVITIKFLFFNKNKNLDNQDNVDIYQDTENDDVPLSDDEIAYHAARLMLNNENSDVELVEKQGRRYTFKKSDDENQVMIIDLNTGERLHQVKNHVVNFY